LQNISETSQIKNLLLPNKAVNFQARRNSYEINIT
jgi:hypothetical protein